jgi:hypothetical protein
MRQELQRDARKLLGLRNLTHPKNSIFQRNKQTNKKPFSDLNVVYHFIGN